jgi:hypothetical protein
MQMLTLGCQIGRLRFLALCGLRTLNNVVWLIVEWLGFSFLCDHVLVCFSILCSIRICEYVMFLCSLLYCVTCSFFFLVILLVSEGLALLSRVLCLRLLAVWISVCWDQQRMS